jgi:hypothetical protein
MTQQLSEQDKEEIRNYVSTASTEEEKKDRRKEMARRKCVSLGVVAAVSAWDTGKLKAIKESKSDYLPSVSAEAQKIRDKLQEVVARTVTERPSVVSAEQRVVAVPVVDTDYDNATKEKWRQLWGAFIEKHVPVVSRPKKRILCMPGRACLEIPIYLSRGFDPKNIVAVEGYDPYKAEFLQNARKYGIVARLGRLEEGMLTEDVLPYDIVSYDFTGPFSPTIRDILRETFIAPAWGTFVNTDTLLMINVMGKREQTSAQKVLDSYSVFSKEDVVEDADEEDDIFIRFEKTQEKLESSNVDMPLHEKRERTLACAVSDMIGRSRRRRESPYHKRLAVLDNESGGCAGEIFALIFSSFDNFLLAHKISSDLARNACLGLIHCMQMVMGQCPVVTHLQPYRYISLPGNSPFMTEMMVLHTPVSRYGQARHMVNFFLDCCQHQMRALSPGSFQVRAQNCILRPKGVGLSKSDTIEFVLDGQVAVSCYVRKLMDTYNEYIHHADDDIAVQKLHNRREVPRELIK